MRMRIAVARLLGFKFQCPLGDCTLTFKGQFARVHCNGEPWLEMPIATLSSVLDKALIATKVALTQSLLLGGFVFQDGQFIFILETDGVAEILAINMAGTEAPETLPNGDFDITHNTFGFHRNGAVCTVTHGDCAFLIEQADMLALYHAVRLIGSTTGNDGKFDPSILGNLCSAPSSSQKKANKAEN